jgi:hypothetical protein
MEPVSDSGKAVPNVPRCIHDLELDEVGRALLLKRGWKE